MKAYLLKKDNLYCSMNCANVISKTKNMEDARVFVSRESAERILALATKKLKEFHVEEIDIDHERYVALIDKITEPSNKERRKFTKNERTTVYNRNDGKCAICGETVAYGKFTVDHIVPLSKGGTNDMNNLQCTCKTCNLIKQDNLPEDFMNKLEEIIVYQMGRNYKKSLYKQIRQAHRKHKLNTFTKIFIG